MAKEKIYPYAVARIRMLENKLLTQSDYIRMAEAKNADEALKILSESSYGQQGALTERNYEQALSYQLSKAYEEVKELAGQESFINIFLFKNDYHNLKVLIKSDISSISADEYLVDGGSVDKEVLKEAVMSKNYDKLPANMEEAVLAAYDSYGKSQNGQVIDIVMDKAAFKDMKEACDKFDNDFTKEYMEYLCDITNLKSLYRVEKVKKPFDMFADVFVEGGSIGINSFRSDF